MHMLRFICGNWLNLLLVGVGASALWVYWMQKCNERRAAATKVILQIDQIEKIVLDLKGRRQLDNTIVYRAPVILDYNSWKECGFLFYGKMGSDDLRIIDDFFLCAVELEKSRSAICHAVSTAWENKDAELQAFIANAVYGNGNANLMISDFISKFNPRHEIFTPDLPIEIFMSNLNQFRFLSGTTAYKKLQKISFRK